MRRLLPSPPFVAATLLLAPPSHGIVFRPPETRIINSPSVIPADGVLAIGTVDGNSGGLPSTWGTPPDSLTDAEGTVWTGVGTDLQIPVAAEVTQVVTVWKPDGEPAVGVATAAFSVSDSAIAVPTVGVVAANDTTTISLSEASVTLDRVLRPRSQSACGTGFGQSASEIVYYLTSSYYQEPVLATEVQVEGAPEVVSQHFLRAERVGVDSGTYFAPFSVNSDGTWQSSRSFVAAQGEYCVGVEVLSLRTEAIESYGPYCVADDGRDWETPLAATTAQIDAELQACPTPPASLLPRYCALRAQRDVFPEGCTSLTQAELDAALAAEPDVSSLAGEPLVDPNAPGAPVVNAPMGGTGGSGTESGGTENGGAASGGTENGGMGPVTLVPAGGMVELPMMPASGGATSGAGGSSGEDGPADTAGASGSGSGLSGVSSPRAGCAMGASRTPGSGALGSVFALVALVLGASRARQTRRSAQRHR